MGIQDLFNEVQMAESERERIALETSAAIKRAVDARIALGKALAEAGLLELGEYVVMRRGDLSQEQINSLAGRLK